MNVLQQSGCVLERNYDESVSGFESVMHGLQAVPRPRLRALAERVIENDGQIDLLRFVLRHSGFERQFVVGDDGKALRRNPITLRSISITSKGNAQFAFVVRSQNNAARYVLGQGLLKDPSVDDFNRK